MESQKEKLMRILNIPEDEAQSIIESDKAIDKGKKLFELPEEGRKVEKKMRQAARNPQTCYKFTTRQRKENFTKSNLITLLSDFLSTIESCQNINVINKERQIQFTIEDNTFELTLIQKRKPK